MGTVESDLVQHNIDMCRHDSKIDEWERRFDLLSKELIKASTGYVSTPKALDVIEKCAGDLVDLLLKMEK